MRHRGVLDIMNDLKIGGRELKKRVGQLLHGEDLDRVLDDIRRLPLKQVVNPLILFLHDQDEDVKWHAVSALGRVVSNLAGRDMEAARVVMRRLMWSLNSESGGIGWGSAETMGEIMACNEQLAGEYASILISYIDNRGNFIENENLQKGVLWALGRLAQVQPDLIRSADALLVPFLSSRHVDHRGLSSWTARAIDSDRLNPLLRQLEEDDDSLKIFLDHRRITCTVGDLARGDIL